MLDYSRHNLEDSLNKFEKERIQILDDAISTIKELSAKLHAAQMERSSQYYNGGWIPCEKRLPEEFWDVLLQYNPYEDVNEIMIGYRCPAGEFPAGGDTPAWFMNGEYYKNFDDVIAWRPLPEPYQPKESEE